jgi:uncharacterized protein
MSIPSSFFESQGFRRDHLMEYVGLKEHLSFADVDVDATPPAELGPLPSGVRGRVLFRPPADLSHYYSPRSGALANAALHHLASRDDYQVVFSPRHARQVGLLDDRRWRVAPLTLPAPLPFASLLKAVDRVVCAGGTLLREAAFLGIPAFSIFQSEVGSVDRALERAGRIRLISQPGECALITAPFERARAMRSGPEFTEALARRILEAAVTRPR